MVERNKLDPNGSTSPHSIRGIKYLMKLALRARRVDAEMGPGGGAKDLVGKGLGTVRARLATAHERLATIRVKKEIA